MRRSSVSGQSQWAGVRARREAWFVEARPDWLLKATSRTRLPQPSSDPVGGE